MPFFEKDNKKKIKELQAAIAEASKRYKRLFDNEDGKWVLKDLAKRSFDKVSTYNADIKKMAMNEGRRSLFNYIRDMVEKDLQQILEDLTKG